jgi:hypothetical protein
MSRSVVTRPSAAADFARLNPSLTAQGLIAETFPRSMNTAATALMIGGTVYLTAIPLFAGNVVTKIILGISNAGVAMTLSKVGLYDKAGARLAVSADQGASWETALRKEISLSAPYTVTVSDAFYVALVAAGGTLPRILGGAAVSTAAALDLIGGSIGGTGVRPYAVMTGQTDLPATVTLAAPSAAPFAFWIGVN